MSNRRKEFKLEPAWLGEACLSGREAATSRWYSIHPLLITHHFFFKHFGKVSGDTIFNLLHVNFAAE